MKQQLLSTLTLFFGKYDLIQWMVDWLTFKYGPRNCPSKYFDWSEYLICCMHNWKLKYLITLSNIPTPVWCFWQRLYWILHHPSYWINIWRKHQHKHFLVIILQEQQPHKQNNNWILFVSNARKCFVIFSLKFYFIRP